MSDAPARLNHIVSATPEQIQQWIVATLEEALERARRGEFAAVVVLTSHAHKPDSATMKSAVPVHLEELMACLMEEGLEALKATPEEVPERLNG
jgi:hypothetical protein